MAKNALDNDILFKGSCYFLFPEIVAALQSLPMECGILAVAKFVVRNILRKRGLSVALGYFSEYVQRFEQLEPTDEELAAAAEIEFEAQQKGLELDEGESVLFAIAESRRLDLLVTGDKRAIVAFQRIIEHGHGRIERYTRVIVLEQVLRRIVSMSNFPNSIRDSICNAYRADQTLWICFSCASRSGDSSSWISALDSYISALRMSASTVLAAS